MLLHEKRLDDCVYFGQLGDEESVEVRTKMGGVVASGKVQSVTPFGVIVAIENDCPKYFSSDYYIFASKESEPPSEVIVGQLNDTSGEIGIDNRVQEKLKQMGEAGDPVSDGTGAKKMEPDDDSEKKDDTKKEKEPVVKDVGNSVDVDKLPDDIKKSIISSSEIGENELNNVMSEISEAALKSMKRVGIKDIEIYDLVKKIHGSVYQIMTGKKMEK